MKIVNKLMAATLCLGLMISTSACAHHYHKAKHQHHNVKVIKALPLGYERIVISGQVYFLHKGVYYQQHKHGFIIVKPRRRR